jgi:hypothetical protein
MFLTNISAQNLSKNMTLKVILIPILCIYQ